MQWRRSVLKHEEGGDGGGGGFEKKKKKIKKIKERRGIVKGKNS